MNNNGAITSDIKSLAFFDLETTGLPDLENYKTQITEMSIVACSTKHFLETKHNETPRVIHKLTNCFNPFKRIQLKATEITKLDNELLEQENKFDENAIKVIQCFLKQLQQPVCMIAHNGDYFDFPLLKKQFEVLNGNIPPTILCCDSLTVFREIDDQNNNSLEKPLEGIDVLQEDDDESIVNLVASELKEIIDQEEQNIKDEAEKLFKDASNTQFIEEVMTDMKKANETTPSRKIKVTEPSKINRDILTTPTNSCSKRPISTLSRRQLFATPQLNSTGKKRFIKGEYTLATITKRLTGNFPAQGHYAELDVMTLMTCALACKNDFLRVLESKCRKFSDVKRF